MEALEIICFSTQPWYGSYWTNKQHIMLRLAKMGHKILYVNPYDHASFGHLFRSFRRKIVKKELMVRLENPQTNLWLYSPIDIIPRLRNGIGQALNQKVRSFLLKKQLARYNFKNPILWIYQPETVDFVDQIPNRLVVYDCVDEYSAFPYYAESPDRKRMIIEKENELLKKAGVVFTTSKTLYEKKRQKNPNTYLVTNVGDFTHFNQVNQDNYQVADEMQKIPQPIFGFVGALDAYKVDFKLIFGLATKHNEWSVVLIGKTAAAGDQAGLEDLKKMKNVYFLGGVDYEETPHFIKAFNVCLIPYNINEYTKSCFPIKFHEFLATGKPLVTTALPDLIDFGGISYLSYNREEFIANCEKAVSEDDPSLRLRRQRVASQNTWDDRIKAILEKIYQSIS